MRKTFGWRTIARPMATRWRWPPDMAEGLRSMRSSSSSIFAAKFTRSSMVALSTLAFCRANAMFWRAVMLGYSA